VVVVLKCERFTLLTKTAAVCLCLFEIEEIFSRKNNKRTQARVDIGVNCFGARLSESLLSGERVAWRVLIAFSFVKSVAKKVNFIAKNRVVKSPVKIWSILL